MKIDDPITKASLQVKHAIKWPPNQGYPRRWEWELAGTYVIANPSNTIAMAADGLRLARFTAPSPPRIGQIRKFLPINYQRNYENKTFYDVFSQILAAWSVVKGTVIISTQDLISHCISNDRNGLIATQFGLTVNTKHIFDFCYATKEDLITCQAVANQSPPVTVRLKLTAGQLEELFIPII